jgi:ribosomal protein L12E/L44/L45/RPP1/RPP2
MQTLLDGFIIEEHQEEPVQRGDKPSEVYKRAEEATREKFYEWFGVRDNACCEHGKINFKLHAGTLWLYRDASGNLKALGDMDGVYRECEHGLMENIRALKKIFRLLEERLGLKVFAVGKDYDDVLHIHVLNINEKTSVRLVEKEFEEMGLQAYVTPLENTDLTELVENFENHFSYMPAVSPDVLQRALDESGKQEAEGTIQGEKKADVTVSEDPCTEIAMQRYGVRSGEVCCRYGKVNTRLHLGALILYKDGSGSFKALADIDYVYSECMKGLIDNIRAFKTIFDHFSSKGMNIYAVSKCFDDCIHVSILGDKSYSKYYTIDNGPPEIRGLKVDIGTFVGSIAEAVKNLERHISYMQAVNPDVLQRGLNVGEGGTVQGVDVALTLTE